MRYVKFTIALLCGSIAGFLTKQALSPREHRQPPPAAERRLHEVVSVLQEIDANFRKRVPQDTPCDPQRLRPLLKGGTAFRGTSPSSLHRDALANFRNGALQGMEFTHPHPWMNSDGLRLAMERPQSPDKRTQFVRHVANDLAGRADVVAIYRSERDLAPTGDQPGEFVGQLSFWDLTDGSFLCATHFEATFPPGEDPDLALQQAATSARERLTQELRLGVLVSER